MWLMAISNFPPQAYTRDTLATAFEWLRTQSLAVREMAQDSDSLVALYLQSLRRQNPNLASSETFKQDLKNLAEGMKQFETPRAQNHEAPRIPLEPSRVGLSFSDFELDNRSLEAITHVQKRFNLSGPTESMRLLISLGFDRAREIFPKS